AVRFLAVANPATCGCAKDRSNNKGDEVMRRSVLAAAVAAVASLAIAVAGAQATTHPATRGATVETSVSSLGRILVDTQGRTLYLFEKDTRGHSACSGQCAIYWPPLLTKGTPAAKAGAKQSLLGVAHRSDGKMQVTYAGHPLYTFVQDTKRGQTNGQNLDKFGAEWYVLGPAGTKIEKTAKVSTPAPSTTTPSTGGGG